MEKQMYESLMEIKNKYDDIQKQLLLPEITSNIKKYTKLSREANEIKNITSSFNQYLEIKQIIKDSKTIIAEEKDHELLDFAKTELEDGENKIVELENKIKILLIPTDPNDNKNVIVEIRGAAGGDEANIFARDLFEIYRKWAASNDMNLKLIETQKSDMGGFSLVVFKIDGNKAYSKLKFESGVHRVQRIPTTETQGRVHTSTATVTVMPEADDTVEIDINPSDLKIDTFRSSGAGGQSVNTTDSAVRITHMPTGLIVSSQDERSQLQNRDMCMKLLKTKLFDLEVQKQQKKDAAFRSLAGTGARAEKVRTYNYPQDRVTDHRVSLSVSLKGVIDGKINNIIETLQAAEQAARAKDAGI